MYGKPRQKEEVFGKSHVRRNDTVVVLSGKDRGRRGKVLRVLPAKGTAIVERVNFTKKHTRPNPQKNQQGGILEREAPIRLAKLQVICPSCSEPSRIGSHRTEAGVSRYCRKCKAEIGK
ncbi:MAG TPA: 50S ribosomal protein L24 [Thermoanaerobaculia bacterium]|nr:50S ribosomal protein L24 [Thermoanaerobaculia bacterium]